MQISELPNWSYVAVPTIRKSALYCFSIGGVSHLLDDIGFAHIVADNTDVVPLNGKLFQAMVRMDRYEDQQAPVPAIDQ